MKTSRLLVVGLLLSVAMGCGGDGDSKRTDLSCAPDAPYSAQACESVHSEVPLQMRCVPAWHPVASCGDVGFLATCTMEEGPVQAILYVYDASALDAYQLDCMDAGGTWYEAPI